MPKDRKLKLSRGWYIESATKLLRRGCTPLHGHSLLYHIHRNAPNIVTDSDFGQNLPPLHPFKDDDQEVDGRA